jgi:hypothetical protein
MPNKTLTIAPNRPLTVALQDPSGRFDFDIGFGSYLTTSGEALSLPRPAVVALNLIDPKPGEEIEIEQHQTGKPGEHPTWTVRLTHRSEMARAEAGEPDTLTKLMDTEKAHDTYEASQEPPTPIRKPAKRAPSVIPGLYDRGTGTHGPAPASEPQTAPALILPAAAIGSRKMGGQIPANRAVGEILAFIKSDPSTANWDAQSVQDLASTVYIAAVKQGWITVWERPQ